MHFVQEYKPEVWKGMGSKHYEQMRNKEMINYNTVIFKQTPFQANIKFTGKQSDLM